jgi:hypothetical protein
LTFFGRKIYLDHNICLSALGCHVRHGKTECFQQPTPSFIGVERRHDFGARPLAGQMAGNGRKWQASAIFDPEKHLPGGHKEIPPRRFRR